MSLEARIEELTNAVVTLTKLIEAGNGIPAGQASAEPVKGKRGSKGKDATNDAPEFDGVAYFRNNNVESYKKVDNIADFNSLLTNKDWSQITEAEYNAARQKAGEGVKLYFYRESTDRLYEAVVGKDDDAITKLRAAEGVTEIDEATFEKHKARQAKFAEEQAKAKAKIEAEEAAAAKAKDDDLDLDESDTDEPAAKAVTADELKSVLIAVRDKVGRNELAALFKKFSAKAFGDLKEEDYGKVYAEAKKVIAQHEDI